MSEYKPLRSVNSEEPRVYQSTEIETKREPSERLISLDAVRGLTMVVMILVNNGPESPPSWWGHAQWNGMGLADWVMPFFLCIGGTSMSLSFAKLFAKDASKWEIFKKVIIRTIKLFLLGLVVQGFRVNPKSVNPLPWPYCDLEFLRIMGILQRIAICYVISGISVLVCPSIRIPSESYESFKSIFTRVPFKYSILWAVGLSFMVCYFGIVFGVYVPDYRKDFVTCEVRGSLEERCNSPDYLDYLILGSQHMYLPYHEPEGLISTISATGSTFFGLYLGLVLFEFKTHKWRLIQWVTSSLFTILVGLIAMFSGIPINKKIYSFSYVLVTGGAMGLLLCLFYVLLDVWQNKIVRALCFPLVFFGMNAIVVFAGDSILWRFMRFIYYDERDQNLYDWFNSLYYEPDWEPYVGQHLWAVTHVIFWMIVAYILYKKNIIFKI